MLESLSHASKTKKEFKGRTAYENHGLKLKIPISPLKLGLRKPLPFLKPTDMIRAMSEKGKIEKCLLGGGSLDDLPTFWTRYQRLYPEHPVFGDGKDLRRCLPILVHADEGRCCKNEQILVVNWQSILGKGTRLSYQQHEVDAALQGLNFMGKTYSTRFLVATLCCVHYRRKKKHGDRLAKLLDALTDDLINFYQDGVAVSVAGQEVTLHAVPLALKGDWPMLAKLGNLEQHFGKKGRPKADSCICHLCRAGSAGVGYEEYDINAKWYESYLQERPWSNPPCFARLPLLPAQELFFQFDLFHVMHKGIVAEFCGSAIDPGFKSWLIFTIFNFKFQHPLMLTFIIAVFCYWSLSLTAGHSP